MSIFRNPSWPKGKWRIEYNKDNDHYLIKDDYGTVGIIYPTLVAHFIVNAYNVLHSMFVE